MGDGTVLTTTTFKLCSVITTNSLEPYKPTVPAKYYLALYSFPLNGSGPIASGAIEMDLANQNKENNTTTILGYDLSLDLPNNKTDFWLVIYADSQLLEPAAGVYFFTEGYPLINLQLIQNLEVSNGFVLNVMTNSQ